MVPAFGSLFTTIAVQKKGVAIFSKDAKNFDRIIFFLYSEYVCPGILQFDFWPERKFVLVKDAFSHEKTPTYKIFGEQQKKFLFLLVVST